ncbi:extracellular solute-binding protein [Paenibacillus sp. D2_2]|uniref:extracellular solute-binding protein n=1 Tax=Paenibacillus sp. D2_2 TaxID=3073092 RepID=UPI002815B196|nr:extracellular solute-binding protein [Paenibacillus sp. D2_2]WMT42422.1 extracellular solute-binding protein [Paenibacillus sp. D2_2]
MKRRNHWVLFALLLLALINLSPTEKSTMVGSKDQERTTEPVKPPSQEKVRDNGRIKVAVRLPESEFNELKAMNDSFMQEHSTEVELVNLPTGEDYTSLQQQFELGASPDVVLLDNVWVRRYAAGGFLLPTESYYSGSLTGEVLSASLAQDEWNGYVWGVPLDADPYVWVYDSEVLREIGHSFPSTLEEWHALIEAWNEFNSPAYLLGLDYNDPYAMMSLLWQLGAKGQGKQEGAESIFNKKSLNEAVPLLEQLQPYMIDTSDDESSDRWIGGNRQDAVITLIPSTEARKYPYRGKKIFFPEPLESGNKMWISGRSFVVTARSKHRDTAGLWISAMTAQIQQRQWHEKTGHLPALKTLYYQAMRSGLPDWVTASFVKGQGITQPVTTNLPELMQQLQETSRSFLYNDINAKQYLKQLDELNP